MGSYGRYRLKECFNPGGLKKKEKTTRSQYGQKPQPGLASGEEKEYRTREKLGDMDTRSYKLHIPNEFFLGNI